MKKKIIILTGIILTAAVLPVFCAQKISSNVKKAVNYMEKGNAAYSLQLVKEFDSYEKRQFIDWIKNNPDKTIPFFYMYMADEIYNDNKDDAVFWYSFGKLRTVEDVKMCKDPSNAQQLAIYGMLARKTAGYMREKGNVYILEQLEKAVEKDEATPLRPNPIWACYHGMSAFTGKVETYDAAKYEEIKKETRQTYIDSMKKHIEDDKNRDKNRG